MRSFFAKLESKQLLSKILNPAGWLAISGFLILSRLESVHKKIEVCRYLWLSAKPLHETYPVVQAARNYL
jgi:hypothetical protein